MRHLGRGFAWKRFFLDLKREVICDAVDDVAAALAFWGVLAVFPFLLFLVSLASTLAHPTMVNDLAVELNRVAPPQVAEILRARVDSLIASKSPGLLTFSALGSIWAGSGGVASLIRALNTAYGVRESRPFWKVRGLAIVTTIAGALLALVAAALVLVTPAVAGWLGEPVATLILWLRIPAAGLVVMILLAVVYHVLPDTEQRFQFLTPGAVVAVALWLAASLGLSAYVQNFGSFDVSYGALGGVIVLLLWMWLSGMAILLGAEINAILHDARRAEPRGGSDQPRGAPTDPRDETASGPKPRPA
jgi:membrane protein